MKGYLNKRVLLTVCLAVVFSLCLSLGALAADDLSSLKIVVNETGEVLVNESPVRHDSYNITISEGNTLSVSFSSTLTGGGFVRFNNQNYSPNEAGLVSVQDVTISAQSKITVTVNPDGKNEKVYTANISLRSKDFGISALNANVSGSGISGSPAFTDFVFSSSMTSFTMNVPQNVSTVTLKPVLANSKATLYNQAGGKVATGGNISVNLAAAGAVTTVTFKVVAEDERHEQEYTVYITRSSVASSNNCNLSAITLSNGALSPVFAAGTTSYTASVSSATVTVTPFLSDGKAKVYLDGEEIVHGRDSKSISVPSSGSVTVDLLVVAENMTTKTYRIVFSRSAGNNANLSGLSIAGNPGGSMSPSNFSSSTNSYSYTNLPSNVSTLQLVPTVADTGATVSVRVNTSTAEYSNGSGVATKAIPLTSGNNSTTTINITVTAADRATAKTYVLTVVKGTASNNARLSDLRVSASYYGSSSVPVYPNFSYDVDDYNIFIPYGTSTLYIYTTADESHATVRINGNVASNNGGYYTVNPSTGTNSYNIEVTAQNGVTKYTYYLTVYRAANNASNDASLSKLEYSTTGTSSSYNSVPSFSSNSYSYSLNVDDAVTSFRIRATVNRTGARVLIDNELWSSGTTKTITLARGTNTIKVVVFAPDCSTSKTYTITVYRGKNNDNTLSSLTGIDGKGNSLSFSPAFNSDKTDYNIVVGDAVDMVALRPVLNNGNASVTVNGNPVSSGSYSQLIELKEKTTVAVFIVSAADNSKKYYTVTITKPNAVSSYKPIRLCIGSRTVEQGNDKKILLASPYLKASGNSHYTMVPIRMISECMGATVDWDGAKQLITIKLNGKVLTMTVGQKNAAIGLDVAPEILNDTTFVPVRYVGETLGAIVDWLGTDQSVTISPK